ncbi:hypothetical protein TVAG_319000 [Trichomonas vaginalis G3]|uniref:Uncharacterized protein n=1 Tax=Trichomonas vaginalis (strain ATCC PRA-98 / G3) TaxID=412133 RepID=A2EP78_TRIV3|nr:tropomyosin family [Trichomonas vaginalis G3]EAY05545.1 hypothetical protein TVAG_319000 [Trichomonas vaginalis G3]KAI5549104.1 tropomyosin family [Trichomonas vaginalis G3]|eukprot:XP_001317768.1 hypothetical protein [Trichomonas vaginalis G3]
MSKTPKVQTSSMSSNPKKSNLKKTVPNLDPGSPILHSNEGSASVNAPAPLIQNDLQKDLISTTDDSAIGDKHSGAKKNKNQSDYHHYPEKNGASPIKGHDLIVKAGSTKPIVFFLDRVTNVASVSDALKLCISKLQEFNDTMPNDQQKIEIIALEMKPENKSLNDQEDTPKNSEMKSISGLANSIIAKIRPIFEAKGVELPTFTEANYQTFFAHSNLTFNQAIDLDKNCWISNGIHCIFYAACYSIARLRKNMDSIMLHRRIVIMDSQMESRLQKMNQKLDSLEQSVNQIKDDQTTMNQKLGALETSVNQIKDDQTTMNQKLGALETSVNQIKDDQTTMNQKLGALETSVNQIKDDQTTMNQKLGALETSVNQIKDDQTTMNQKLGALETSVNQIKDDQTTMNQKLGALETSVNQIKDDQTTMNQKLSKLDSLEQSVNNITQMLTKLNAQYETNDKIIQFVAFGYHKTHKNEGNFEIMRSELTDYMWPENQ